MGFKPGFITTKLHPNPIQEYRLSNIFQCLQKWQLQYNTVLKWILKASKCLPLDGPTDPLQFHRPQPAIDQNSIQFTIQQNVKLHKQPTVTDEYVHTLTVSIFIQMLKTWLSNTMEMNLANVEHVAEYFNSEQAYIIMWLRSLFKMIMLSQVQHSIIILNVSVSLLDLNSSKTFPWCVNKFNHLDEFLYKICKNVYSFMRIVLNSGASWVFARTKRMDILPIIQFQVLIHWQALLTWDLRASNWGLIKVTSVASSFIKLTTDGMTWGGEGK